MLKMFVAAAAITAGSFLNAYAAEKPTVVLVHGASPTPPAGMA